MFIKLRTPNLRWYIPYLRVEVLIIPEDIELLVVVIILPAYVPPRLRIIRIETRANGDWYG